jgi:poly(3-hydroxybutyrate) depolymerase
MRSGSRGGAVARVPTIVFHGDRDAVVHPRNGEELVAQQVPAELGEAMSVDSAADANGHGYTRRSLRAESGQPLVEHWVIHGAGHAWSGGSPRGSHTDPRGPDASSEMLRFFLASGPR